MGEKCETDARDQFVGSWRGTARSEDESKGEKEVVSTIMKSSASPIRLIVDKDLNVDLISPTRFIVHVQTHDQFTYAGEGTLREKELDLKLIISSGGRSAVVSYSLTKQ
jgi:hypothetical protein